MTRFYSLEKIKASENRDPKKTNCLKNKKPILKNKRESSCLSLGK